ncbi:MAG: hypothetical protein CM1200mP24_08400 [Gammaproteobacteria bacterium]|nr:MAG: hypothetical protein CM1200mP24_08400 [Gammaproteobacteria bacterium]
MRMRRAAPPNFIRVLFNIEANTMSPKFKIDLLKALPMLNLKNLRGLNDSVTILRDQWGIPHIRQPTNPTFFFGRDFLPRRIAWHMDYDVIVPRSMGEMAEPRTFSR